eukprot:1550890-Rhodomonas_salina.3
MSEPNTSRTRSKRKWSLPCTSLAPYHAPVSSTGSVSAGHQRKKTGEDNPHSLRAQKAIAKRKKNTTTVCHMHAIAHHPGTGRAHREDATLEQRKKQREENAGSDPGDTQGKKAAKVTF